MDPEVGESCELMQSGSQWMVSLVEAGEEGEDGGRRDDGRGSWCIGFFCNIAGSQDVDLAEQAHLKVAIVPGSSCGSRSHCRFINRLCLRELGLPAMVIFFRCIM